MRPLVPGVLAVDAVLLAVVELMYLPLRVGAWPVPVSIVVALVTTPWLVRAAAGRSGGPAAAAPLAAWVVTVLVVGIGGPGGDVLLPADWRSALLLAAGMFPAAFVLGRALRRQAPGEPAGPAGQSRGAQ